MAFQLKDAAVGKRAKISEAQLYMMVAVFATAVLLGITLSLVSYFFQRINFNNKILGRQDNAIRNYTETISSTGLCVKPKGDTYNNDELNSCNPNNITIDQVPESLKYNILNNLASNEDLASVPKETNADCINPNTNKYYTFQELRDNYNTVSEHENNEKELQTAIGLMQTCTALRIIPDALPSSGNQFALLAGLNKLFLISDWEPESLSPNGASTDTNTTNGVESLSVRLSVEADTAVTMDVLHNIERSIREFDIKTATIEWKNDQKLSLEANATAYHTAKTTIDQGTEKIKPGDDKK